MDGCTEAWRWDTVRHGPPLDMDLQLLVQNKPSAPSVPPSVRPTPSPTPMASQAAPSLAPALKRRHTGEGLKMAVEPVLAPVINVQVFSCLLVRCLTTFGTT